MRNKLVIALAVISFLILGAVTLWNYRPESENTFGIDNFYAPEDVEVLNPKSRFEAYTNADLFSSRACLQSMKSAVNPIVVSGTVKYWISDNRNVYWGLEEQGITNLGIDTSAGCKPFKEGDYIIAPATIEFNSNNTQLKDGHPYLDFYVGSDKAYNMIIDNIDCWWCHIGVNSSNHTKRYGKNGECSSASPGYILGIASEETTVTVWKKDEGGNYTIPSTLDEYYGFQ